MPEPRRPLPPAAETSRVRSLLRKAGRLIPDLVGEMVETRDREVKRDREADLRPPPETTKRPVPRYYT